jgi:hypothetical protein
MKSNCSIDASAAGATYSSEIGRMRSAHIIRPGNRKFSQRHRLRRALSLRLELSAAAIDDKLGARDVGSIVGSEECDRRCDLLRLAEALRRNLLKQGLAEFPSFGVGKAQLAEQRRLDHARTDGIDANVSANQLGGKCPCEVTQRGLRGGHC